MPRKTLFLFFLILFHCQPEKRDLVYRNYIGSWSPDASRILFYSDRNGNWDIFICNADGTDLNEISASPANETEPNWHPQKEEFAFASDESGARKIYVCDLETEKIIRLSTAPGNHAAPAWSPDGTHLAFLSEEDQQWKLIVMRVSDSTLHHLYTGSTYPGRPTWSTRGDQVMYSVAVDGKETLHYATLDGQVAQKFVTGYNSCGNAVISPDGSRILFDAHHEDKLESGDGKWEMYAMNLADSSITRLTNNDKDDWGGRWSPDGSRVLFLGSGLNNTGYELFAMNADGSTQVQLTDRKRD